HAAGGRKPREIDSIESREIRPERRLRPLIPQFASQRKPRVECHVSADKTLDGRRPPARIETVVEHARRREVDEVTLLMETVPNGAATGTDVRRVSSGNPRESADGAPRAGQIDLQARGERHTRERRGLLDRLIVVVQP